MARNILKVDNPNDYAAHVGAPRLHPLIAMVHYDEHPQLVSSLNQYGVYGLFIQRQFPESLSYGTTTLRVGDGSIIAVAPGQLGGAEDTGRRLTLSGWALLWSPELMHGTHLENAMRDYPFFSYFATEALRMEPDEWQALDLLLHRLRHELRHHDDSAALRAVALAYVRLVLEYCNRIYQRQRSQHDSATTDVLKRFHRVLEEYFLSGRQERDGLPTVAHCASRLAYSPRYFGDMVHRATGGTAIGQIHAFVINEGKHLLMNGHNISETSRLLGFKFPHHFTRLFKKMTGLTPSQFLGK